MVKLEDINSIELTQIANTVLSKRDLEIIEMHNNGITIDEIAKKIGISEDAVRLYLVILRYTLEDAINEYQKTKRIVKKDKIKIPLSYIEEHWV